MARAEKRPEAPVPGNYMLEAFRRYAKFDNNGPWTAFFGAYAGDRGDLARAYLNLLVERGLIRVIETNGDPLEALYGLPDEN
jgi:hypothetical protein